MPEQNYTFHVNGMHCNACEVLIEENFSELPSVKSVKANLAKQQVMVQGSFDKAPEAIAQMLTSRIKEHGYSLSVEKQKSDRKLHEFTCAVPIALLVAGSFIVLQKSGILNVSFSSNVSYGTAFFIGLIASVSTCLAVVGGLVLSVSANYAKSGDAWKPQALFHVGRLLSFFVLGGLIGLLGSSFRLGLRGNLILAIIVAFIMLILGINLLDVFHTTKRLQLAMPKVFSRGINNLSKKSHWVTPFLVGIATFFLPCGFTQSMQLYTLTTGSFLAGGLTMLVFALGTLPVLALLSFGAFSIAHKPWKGVFFKTAGLIVVALAIINALNALAVAGIIAPIFNI